MARQNRNQQIKHSFNSAYLILANKPEKLPKPNCGSDKIQSEQLDAKHLGGPSALHTKG